MKSFIAVLAILSFFAEFEVVKAQDFEWSRGFGTKGFNENAVLSCAEPDGGITTIVSSFTNIPGSPLDTLLFDTFKFINPINPPSQTSFFLVRLDSNGKVIRVKNLGIINPSAFCKDAHGNYFVGAQMGSYNFVFGSDTIDRTKGNLITLKFDNQFNYLGYYQTGGNSRPRGYKTFKYANGHIVFIAWLAESSRIGDSLHNFSGVDGAHIFGEIDTATGKVKWSKVLASSILNFGFFTLHDIVQMPDQTIFIAGATFEQNHVIGNDSFNRYSGFVIKTDSAGNYIKRKLLKGGRLFRQYDLSWPNACHSITTDGKDLIISGYLGSNIMWDGKWVGKFWDSSIRGYEGFIASLSTNLDEKFFYKPEFISKGFRDTLYSSFKIFINQGYIYAQGHSNFNLRAGCYTFKPQIFGNNYDVSKSFLLKLDLAGNLLTGGNLMNDSIQGVYYPGYYYGIYGWSGSWGNLGWAGNWPDTAWTGYVIAASNNALFMTGKFANTLKLGQHSVQSNGRKDAFVVKITDNNIYRGHVSPGPYCAGDTFNIPYVARGYFDSLNYFIAELSNDQGVFDSTARTLGGLQAFKDSVIQAVIPRYNVASSDQYRIRIRSTCAPGYNHYQTDTLRLTIYSRDKASAGKDFGICPGDTTWLHARGGTNYQWSPVQNMSDSAGRRTQVWPEITTKYQVIVSDSSGCSATDTAYVVVEIRNAKIRLSAGDTIVCIDDYINLRADFTGVDSSQYTWEWWMQEFGWDNLIRTGKAKSSDVLKFHFDLGYSVKLKIMLDNGCEIGKDTAEINVLIPTAIKLSSDPAYRTVCHNELAKFVATGKGGTKPNYQFQWTDYNTGKLLGNKDTLYLRSDTIRKIQVSLNDGCMEKGDTQYVFISVRPSLVLSSNIKDTVLCYGENVQFEANGSGGDTAAHQFSWLLNGQLIGTGKTFLLEPALHFNDSGGTKTLAVVLSDNCTADNDTQEVKITLIPKLKANITGPTDLCFGETQRAWTWGSGGIGNYTLQWFNGDGTPFSISDTVTFSHLNKSFSGIRSFYAIATDGCSLKDSFAYQVNYLDLLRVFITPEDSCFSTGLELYSANASGSKNDYSYQWFEGLKPIGNLSTISPTEKLTQASYKVIVKSACSKDNDSAVAVRVLSRKPNILFSINPDTGCEVLTTTLQASNLNRLPNRYRYIAGSLTGNFSADSAFVLKLPKGSYKSQIIAKTDYGCEDTFLGNTIIVHPGPKALYRIESIDYNSVIPAIQFTNLSSGAATYKWDFDIYGKSTVVHPKVAMPESGLVRTYLIAISPEGCTDSVGGLTLIRDDYVFWMPNSFTPGKDGLNDVLEPYFQGVLDYRLKIMNRKGLLLFDGVNTGWDGAYKGVSVPEGSYIYDIEFLTTKNQLIQRRGIFVLLNNRD